MVTLCWATLYYVFDVLWSDGLDLRFKDQVLLDTDYVIHFPVPMTKVWDNVIYTCSVQLLFRNEKEVDEWCKVRGVPRGDVRPVQQIWP